MTPTVTIPRATLDKVREALEPFANSCFNDNRDFTVSRGVATYEDYIRAYDVYRDLASLLNEQPTKPKGGV